MSHIAFTKMQGLGNDFMVIDATRRALNLAPDLIKRWSNRHYGIGFDQLLLIEAPRSHDTDFFYRIFNADGSEVTQCGNGARCLARFVLDKGLSQKAKLSIETASSRMILEHCDDGEVKVAMGVPEFEPASIPFQATSRASTYTLMVDDKPYTVCILALGNPHCVLQVADVKTAPVTTVGAAIAKLAVFPQSVNVGFMQIISPQQVDLRVYERGVGETLACGSGACAAVVAGRLLNVLQEQVTVTLPGGTLSIHCPDISQVVWMKGPAVTVYEGEITF